MEPVRFPDYRFDWLKEMQFPDNNVRESKQSANAYWSIATKREPARERQPIRHPVNAKLVILVRERSRLRLAKPEKVASYVLKSCPSYAN